VYVCTCVGTYHGTVPDVVHIEHTQYTCTRLQSVQAQYWNNISYIHSTYISMYPHMVAKEHTHHH